MRKICFIQHASEWPLFKPLAKELEEYGLKPLFVCKSRAALKEYKSAGFSTEFIAKIFLSKGKISRKEIEAYDKKYGPPGVSQIGDSDVQLKAFFKGRERQKQELIVKAYKFWEGYFSQNRISYVLVRETATFATRSAYNVCKKRNIPLAQIAIGPGDEHFSLDDVQESHMWSELERALSKGPRKLSPKEKREVKAFIRSKLSGIKEKMALRFVPPNLFKTIKNLIGFYLKDTKANFQKDPVLIASFRFGRRRLLKKIIWKYITSPFFRYDKVKSEPYVYFPVFSGEETSYLVSDHFWARNELSLIKEVAFSLPAGHFLYVKEHPTNPGDLSYGELKELKEIENIKVLHPSNNSERLIRKSEAVCVVQGTSAWEAFLAKIPAIVIGRPFFAYSNLVYRLDSISNLSEVIWRALKNGKKIYKEREKEWLWFIHSAIKSAGLGQTVKLTPPYGFPGDQENAKKMASYIKKRIEKKNL